MTNRNDVYAAIDSERDYQEMRKQRDNGQQFHSVEEFILYMEYYLQETRKIASTVWGSEAKPQTLEFLRKVVALGVACMEVHGAPQRKDFERTRERPEQHIVLDINHAIRQLQQDPSKGAALLELVNPVFNREFEKAEKLISFVQRFAKENCTGTSSAFIQEARDLLAELDEEDVEVKPLHKFEAVPDMPGDEYIAPVPEAAPAVLDWSDRPSYQPPAISVDARDDNLPIVPETENTVAEEHDDIPF